MFSLMKSNFMSLKNYSWVRKAVYFWRNWRNKHSFVIGKSNTIINNGGVRICSRVQIIGNSNKLIIEKGCVLLNSLIKMQGNNNAVFLKANSYISGAELWIEDNNCTLSIGKRSFVGHHTHLACTENDKKLIIGDDCMLSSYVQIRTGDSHSIVDLEGNRINPAQSVIIGNHCWIGEGAKVMKGVILEGDDVVSTGAIVTKSFGKYLLVGGTPAEVLKNDINWKSERL